MLPPLLPLRRTVHASAFDIRIAFSRMARAWRSSSVISDLPRGIDDVDAGEVGRGGAVRHGARLRRLPLAVVEGAAEPVVALVAGGLAGVPELLGVGLVGHVAQHPHDLPFLDLVEQLAAELEVVALLVDGV